MPSPAVESRPGHPQLGDHLLDRQQRVIRGSRCSVRGGGGPAGSGWGSRGRPVRGSATTDAPLRPPRQVRPPPGRPRRTAPRGCRETGKKEGPRRRGRAACRAAWSCRRGSPTGPGAGSRTVADGTLPPAAGRRSGLASRPGPQASTRTFAGQVKSAPPQAGTGLTPGPEPRVDTAGASPGRTRAPPRERAGHGPGTAKGARWRVPARHATVVLTLRAARQPDEGVPACRQHAALPQGSVMGRVGPVCRALPATTEIGFSGPFFTRCQKIGSCEIETRGCGNRRRRRSRRVVVGGRIGRAAACWWTRRCSRRLSQIPAQLRCPTTAHPGVPERVSHSLGSGG